MKAEEVPSSRPLEGRQSLHILPPGSFLRHALRGPEAAVASSSLPPPPPRPPTTQAAAAAAALPPPSPPLLITCACVRACLWALIAVTSANNVCLKTKALRRFPVDLAVPPNVVMCVILLCQRVGMAGAASNLYACWSLS